VKVETFSFDLGPQWRARAAEVSLGVNELYFPSDETIVVHVFFNQPDAGSSTAIENNPHFAFRFVLRSRQRFSGNEKRGLLPWTPPGAKNEDPPLSFIENITKALNRLQIEGGILDVRFVPYDPKNQLLGSKLDLRGGVSLLLGRP